MSRQTTRLAVNTRTVNSPVSSTTILRAETPSTRARRSPCRDARQRATRGQKRPSQQLLLPAEKGAENLDQSLLGSIQLLEVGIKEAIMNETGSRAPGGATCLADSSASGPRLPGTSLNTGETGVAVSPAIERNRADFMSNRLKVEDLDDADHRPFLAPGHIDGQTDDLAGIDIAEASDGRLFDDHFATYFHLDVSSRLQLHCKEIDETFIHAHAGNLDTLVAVTKVDISMTDSVRMGSG